MLLDLRATVLRPGGHRCCKAAQAVQVRLKPDTYPARRMAGKGAMFANYNWLMARPDKSAIAAQHPSGKVGHSTRRYVSRSDNAGTAQRGSQASCSSSEAVCTSVPSSHIAELPAFISRSDGEPGSIAETLLSQPAAPTSRSVPRAYPGGPHPGQAAHAPPSSTGDRQDSEPLWSTLRGLCCYFLQAVHILHPAEHATRPGSSSHASPSLQAWFVSTWLG